jgi:hypothetical protein
MCGKAGWFVRGREYGAGLLQLDENQWKENAAVWIARI